MNGYAWLMLPLSVLAFALIIHGFPNLITINKNYYGRDYEDS